ncbi:hypothetical protein H9I45_04185 [Polaribacter haliotis]|uniref:DUF4870 domain-containing protein n=1 Tax=Polaribacter haliotis TaxID=1888915 RepID=A0A7L8AI56_9FLAO|nr:hypothetical protein [Polaribacter haliotis]QOD61657.1 hypothetical protein H9I45_04185 [Polaribacter haliotis]
MENTTAKDGKVIAIISYITIIGTLIAYILNKDKKNYFASFHIRQALGIGILYLINQWIIYAYMGRTAGWAVGIFIFVLWVIALIGVIQDEEKKVPVLGDHFQEWFKNI